MKKKIVSLVLVSCMGVAMLAGCGSKTADTTEEAPAATTEAAPAEEVSEEASEVVEELSASAENESVKVLDETEITVFAAKSLNTVLDDLIAQYNETQPNVTVTASYDSSGTLLTQIEEGAAVDVFFSAAQKQMNTLQDDDGLVVDGTRHNVVNNQLVVVTYPDSNTEVTGLEDLDKAANAAICDGSVPAGKYTRQALVTMGKLAEVEDVSTITTDEISEAFGGLEITECANVGAAATAVAEQSDEVGTCYYSDTYGMEDQLEILQIVSYDLTGDIIYPIAQVVNEEADDLEKEAAVDFINFITSDYAKATFDKYYFDTDVED